MAKKHARKNNPAPSPPPAGAPAPNLEAAASSTPAAARPPWRQTGWLLAGGWGALVVCTLLWRLWTGRPLIVVFAAGAIGICYSLVVLYDRFREE